MNHEAKNGPKPWQNPSFSMSRRQFQVPVHYVVGVEIAHGQQHLVRGARGVGLRIGARAGESRVELLGPESA